MAARGVIPALRIMLALVLALALLQPALHARLLSPRVAVWFGLDGRAMLWAGRGWLLAAATLPAVLIGVAGFGLLPELGRRAGGETLERLGLWLAILSAAFFAVLAQLVFEANAAAVPVLAMDELGWLAASYLLFVVAWAWVLRRPRR